MTCDAIRDRLDALLSGKLDPAEQEAMELHLAGCGDCRTDLEAARCLAGPTAGLPREMVPATDLWSGIIPRLKPQVRRLSLPIRWLAAAAVLPDSIGGERLGQVMRRFTGALGVRCDHCHVGQGDLANFDFASDDKPAKNRARVMLKMVQAINGTHMAELDVPADQRLAVTCVTCHRGAARPVMLDALLETTIDSAGIDAAVGRYEELKKRYYGGFTYDFSRGMLTGLGERLLRRQKYSEAVKVLELEVANNGDDVRTLVTLGGAQAQAGDRDGAKKSFDKALGMAPENMRPMIQQQVDRALKNPPSHD